MNGTSAETYIRRCAEDELHADHHDDDEPRALRERARALVFAGLLGAAVASRILSAYGRARALRGHSGYHDDEHHQVVQIPDPVRVAGCSGEIDVSGTTIFPRLVALGTHQTRLAATIRPGSGAPASSGRRGHRPPFFDVHEITLRDDKGASVTAHFSGGGGREWRGWYGAEPGLSPQTAWIEVEGVRLALTEADAGATVTVETLATAELPIAERAARYLDHCAQTSLTEDEPGLLAVIADTFVTCGALPPDSAEVTAILGADEDGAAHPMAPLGGGRGWGFRPRPHGRRGRQPGAETVLVGVTTPAIDGVSVTVTDLMSAPDGFQVEVIGVGRVEFGHGHSSSLDIPRLAVRATDDLRNRYRGWIAEFEYGSEGFSGTISFAPALHRDASVVNLEFSTERARAVVRVPVRRGGPT